MSERCSFTSEYIHNRDDYRKLRDKFNQYNDKYLRVSPPIRLVYESISEDVPIIQGKTASMAVGCEYEVLESVLEGLVTEEPVRFVILTDSSDKDTMIIKDSNGNVLVYDIIKNQSHVIDED